MTQAMDRVMTALCLTAMVAAGFCGTARADNVALGTDYFTTQPGAFDYIDLPGVGLFKVNFKGLPLNPARWGATDTIVERTQDIPLNVAPTSPNILITALSLESTNIPGETLFVSLDPNNLANDTGMLTIDGSVYLGGTFTSSLDVFFDICAAPSSTGVGCGSGISLGTGSLQLTGASTWSPTPGKWDFLKIAADCDSPNCTPAQMAADQAANWHDLNPQLGEVDFFPGLNKECSGSNACHPVAPTTPEPASLVLLGTGLLALGGLKKRNSR